MLCTIAGLDPTGGAGIAADLRAFAAQGAWGIAVVTAVTVQDGAGVRAVEPLPPELVAEQVRAALAQDPAAVKIGMLATAGIVEAVARALAGYRGPVVLDPVLAAGAGGALLEEAAVDLLLARLSPRTTLLTPNRPEAARLLGLARIAEDEALEAARALRARGWMAVLLKGGHGDGADCVDYLVGPGGEQRLARRRLPGPTLRGTGCTLASALAARLAGGTELAEAAARAGDWLHEQIAAARAAGHGRLLG